MTTVVDASVLVAAAVDSGPDGQWAESVLGDGPLAGPELVLAEATNILRRLERAGEISRSEATGAHRDLLRLDGGTDEWLSTLAGVGLAGALPCPLPNRKQVIDADSGLSKNGAKRSFRHISGVTRDGDFPAGRTYNVADAAQCHDT